MASATMLPVLLGVPVLEVVLLLGLEEAADKPKGKAEAMLEKKPPEDDTDTDDASVMRLRSEDGRDSLIGVSSSKKGSSVFQLNEDEYESEAIC